MASSTRTEYYKLSQFQPNDTANWLDDYNPDMQKIDTALHKLSEQTAPLQDQINELDARLDTEEAQSQLQGEQIVSLQTAINRNNENVANLTTRVNNAVGGVNSLSARVEAMEGDVAANVEGVLNVTNGLRAYQERTDPVIEQHSTDIAALKTGVAENKDAIDRAKAQFQDFSNITTTIWTLGAQITGNLRMYTTLHNMRELRCGMPANIEFHDASQFEMYNIINSTGTDQEEVPAAEYPVFAFVDGKVFNTNWPEDTEEQPNNALNYIGCIAICQPNGGPSGSIGGPGRFTVDVGWHYDVAANRTYLLLSIDRTDDGAAGWTDYIATGQGIWNNLVFIQD